MLSWRRGAAFVLVAMTMLATWGWIWGTPGPAPNASFAPPPTIEPDDPTPAPTRVPLKPLLPPILQQLADVEARLPQVRVQNYFFQHKLKRASLSVVRPHLRPFTPPSGTEPIPGSCPSSLRPDQFCMPNLGREWSAQHRVFPVSYSLPPSEYVQSPPPKTQNCSIIIPRVKSTYRFKSEREYKEEYAKSFYCITFKKGGWDTLRHYEIIAAGCMPYIVDLEYTPEHSMTHLPKALLLEARSLPGVHFDCAAVTVRIDDRLFPVERYNELLRKVLDHARKYMTTEAVARYVLGVAGFPNVESLSKKPRVLYVSKSMKGAPLKAQGNYNTWFLWHGLRSLLGKLAVDSHEISFLYEQPLEVKQKQRSSLYGLGFGYAYRLPRLEVDRADLSSQLQRGLFDVVIYSDPFAAAHKAHHHLWLLEDAQKHLSRDRILILHAPDIPYPHPGAAGYDIKKLYDFGTVLQREIPDCRYYVPPSRDSEAMKRCVWYLNKNCFDDANVATAVAAFPSLKSMPGSPDYVWEWPVKEPEAKKPLRRPL